MTYQGPYRAVSKTTGYEVQGPNDLCILLGGGKECAEQWATWFNAAYAAGRDAERALDKHMYSEAEQILSCLQEDLRISRFVAGGKQGSMSLSGLTPLLVKVMADGRSVLVSEITARVKKLGWKNTAKCFETHAVAARLHTRKDLFVRTAPRTYRLLNTELGQAMQRTNKP